MLEVLLDGKLHVKKRLEDMLDWSQEVRQGCKRWQRDDKSRMMGDCHVRICEGLGVKFPRSRHLSFQWTVNFFMSDLDSFPTKKSTGRAKKCRF
jgi:hypothetical protein